MAQIIKHVNDVNACGVLQPHACHKLMKAKAVNVRTANAITRFKRRHCIQRAAAAAFHTTVRKIRGMRL